VNTFKMTSATAVYDLISTVDAGNIDDFATLFAYEGFNPAMIHAHMAQMMTDKSISLQEFTNDMRALITLGAMKGNYTTKNAGKISTAGKTKADALYAKYQLKMGSLGTDKKAIILPRVLSAFPELTTKVILRLPDRDFGESVTELPRIIKNPVFPSLIPKRLPTDCVDTLIWLYTVYSAEQSLIISSIKDFDDAYVAQKSYVVIAFNSTVPKEETRIRMFKQRIEEIVQAVSTYKDLTLGKVPSNKVNATRMRAEIENLVI
jgi:hypothetical protein